MRFGSVITTYRCNAKCNMCDIWQHPTRPNSEIGPEVYKKLPHMESCNVTGGEPFLRKDLDEIVTVLKERADRVVISSNGWHVDRTLALFEKHGNSLGLRVSIEGLPKANDDIRGMRDGFDRALRILTTLSRMGIKDIGFGLTLQDYNAKDMLELYQLAKMMNVEFSTAALHNSFYFHKTDNRIDNLDVAIDALKRLTEDLLVSRKPKDWFRAYFNYGLMNYLQGNPRLLPCRMAHDAFFIEPNGDILPCNAMDERMPFGNLVKQDWDEIWYSEEAETTREVVRNCPKQCWMVGSVSQEMKKHIQVPAKWILEHKVLKRPIETPARRAVHPHELFGKDGPPASETMKLFDLRKRERHGSKRVAELERDSHVNAPDRIRRDSG